MASGEQNTTEQNRTERNNKLVRWQEAVCLRQDWNSIVWKQLNVLDSFSKFFLLQDGRFLKISSCHLR